MDGVQDFWEGEYTYRCILTNDYDSSVRDSVMRGHVNAIRTFKGLVADLRIFRLLILYFFFKFFFSAALFSASCALRLASIALALR